MTDRVRAWPGLPQTITLGESEVHVWCASLDRPSVPVEDLSRLLAPDEARRAGRFLSPEHRAHFVVARAGLRLLLGAYLSIPAEDVRFGYGAHGKPILDPLCDLRFNVSHSHGLALYAFSRGREVGVDVEKVRSGVVAERIAERFFSAREIAELQALPREMHDEGFFNCWTRKEAYVKATGVGLSLPLDAFDVSLAPGEPAVLRATRHDPREAERWQLFALRPAPGYVGALAVEGPSVTVRCADISAPP